MLALRDLIKHSLCAKDVDVHVKSWFFQGRTHAGHGGQMHDNVEFSLREDRLEIIDISDIPCFKMELRMVQVGSDVFVLHLWVVKLAEIVEDGDLIASPQQAIN